MPGGAPFLIRRDHEWLDVTVFAREVCPFCSRAKGMPRDAGIQYDELILNRD